MNRKSLFKLLSLALALCLIFSGIPTAAMAEALDDSFITSGCGGGQNGTSLKVECSANADLVRTYLWTIDKSVTPSSWNLYDGEQGVSTYTVNVVKTGGYTDAGVFTGKVTVKNTGSVATQNLTIGVVLSDPSGNAVHATASVNMSGKPVLNPGESHEYAYSIPFTGLGGFWYKVKANVSITNHSGDLGEVHVTSDKDTVMFPWWISKEANKNINVSDSNGMSWPFSATGSKTYNTTFTLADVGVNNNIATIDQTGQSDSAKVTVTRRNTFTVTFDLDGKGTSGNTLQFTGLHDGDPFPAAPTVIANAGWTFANSWSPALPLTVTKSETYVAQYTQNTYTVNFDLDGKGTSDDTLLFAGKHYGDTIVIPQVTANTGWTFTGWNIEPSATVLGNATYVAQYTQNVTTFTVTYHGNGNTGGTAPVDANNYAPGGTVTVMGPGTLVKAGFTFGGWVTAYESYFEAGNTFGIYRDENLIAQWIPNHTVTYHGNGNTGGTAPVDSTSYEHTGLVTVMGPGTLTKEGFTFAGWKTAFDSYFYPEGTFNIYRDENLYAQWTAQNVYTVTFDLAGKGTSSDTLVFAGKHLNDTIAIPVVTANAGWTFTGWDIEPSTTVLGNATYVAQYTQNVYTVTFDLAGKGTSSDTLVFAGKHLNETITVPVVTANAGWTFTGWDIEPSTTVLGNATYVAQYTQNVYTVTFDLAGKGTSSDTLVFAGKHLNDTITVPVVTANAGWTFTGWDIEPSTTVLGNATYVAQYTQNVYTITFVPTANGSSTNTLVFGGLHYGDSFPVIPTIAANTGWRFTGWDPDLTAPPATVSGNATYTAQFAQKTAITLTANSATVTYDGTEHSVTGFSGLPAGLTLNGVSASGKGTNAGNYNVTFTTGTVQILDGAADVTDHYMISYTNGKLTINPKAVTITVANKTKTRGNEDPALSATVTGLVGSDIIQYTLSRVAGAAVGTYDITASYTPNANYAVTVINGVLTINAAPVNPTATPLNPTPTPTTTTIVNPEVPAGGLPGASWALLNLILAIGTALVSMGLLIGYFKKQQQQNGSESDQKRKGFMRIFSLVPGIGAIVAFILTENMQNPMIIVDMWTLLMVGIAAVQGVVLYLARKNSEDVDKVDTQNA